MSGPPLSGSSPAQAAGSSVAGSSRPQALIQRRQRLTDEPRLSTLVILSQPAPQPAQAARRWPCPRRQPLRGSSVPRNRAVTRRHAASRLRALPCVPSGLVVCAGHPEPCPAATGGSGFTIEIGSDFFARSQKPLIFRIFLFDRCQRPGYRMQTVGRYPYIKTVGYHATRRSRSERRERGGNRTSWCEQPRLRIQHLW